MKMLLIFRLFFFFNWNSLHARLNSHYKAWSFKKKDAQKRLKHTGNLFRKDLQLIGLLILNLKSFNYRSKESIL